ncbi:hypothetical protein [Hydrogenophaga sp. OTU3427]|uniref:hypothetical protein n=1 Tax=Hydrogenophaga sp. OTU3427 TaxID=3043856 RepID=UPI00313B224C
MSTVFSPAPASLGVSPIATSHGSGSRRGRSGFDGARGLAALLLAAVVAALVVVADQLIDTWADGHVFLVWVLLWAVVFAATLVFAGTARRMAQRTLLTLNAWSKAAAQRRAEARMWEIAKSDPRVMSELVAARQRADDSVETLARTEIPDSETALKLASRQMPSGYRRAMFYI